MESVIKQNQIETKALIEALLTLPKENLIKIVIQRVVNRDGQDHYLPSSLEQCLNFINHRDYYEMTISSLTFIHDDIIWYLKDKIDFNTNSPDKTFQYDIIPLTYTMAYIDAIRSSTDFLYQRLYHLLNEYP